MRLFASLREAAGRGEVELQLPPAATAEDAWRALSSSHPALLAPAAEPGGFGEPALRALRDALHEGDEVVFIPPVSGG